MDYPTLPIGFHWAPLGGSWCKGEVIPSSPSPKRNHGNPRALRLVTPKRWAWWSLLPLIPLVVVGSIQPSGIPRVWLSEWSLLSPWVVATVAPGFANDPTLNPNRSRLCNTVQLKELLVSSSVDHPLARKKTLRSLEKRSEPSVVRVGWVIPNWSRETVSGSWIHRPDISSQWIHPSHRLNPIQSIGIHLEDRSKMGIDLPRSSRQNPDSASPLRLGVD